MHDLDRTLLETEYPGAFELPDEAESAGGLSPAEELELASEMLEVGNDTELEQFLGSLFSRAVRGARNFARSSTGRSLGRMLKSGIKDLLPYASSALNTYISAKVGKGAEEIGPDAGRVLGLELEGLSPEDREFEICRQLVRLVSAAAQQASLAPPDADPDSVAHHAIATAAATYAPGLLQRGGHRTGAGPLRHDDGGSGAGPARRDDGRPAADGALPRSGRWFRRGHTITLYGIYGAAAKSAANGRQ